MLNKQNITYIKADTRRMSRAFTLFRAMCIGRGERGGASDIDTEIQKEKSHHCV